MKNKRFIITMLMLVSLQTCVILPHESKVTIDVERQERLEAKFDLLLAYVQKQTELQTRQMACQVLIAGIVLSLACTAFAMSLDLGLLNESVCKGFGHDAK